MNIKIYDICLRVNTGLEIYKAAATSMEEAEEYAQTIAGEHQGEVVQICEASYRLPHESQLRREIRMGSLSDDDTDLLIQVMALVGLME